MRNTAAEHQAGKRWVTALGCHACTLQLMRSRTSVPTPLTAQATCTPCF